MARHKLPVRIRDHKGKEVAKRLRRENRIPAIFYGPKTTPLKLVVNYPDLERIIRKTSGESPIFELQIETDKGSDTRIVMLKELQIDPVEDIYLHADFYEISMDRELTVNIAVRLINTPSGVTKGGVLQHVRREITVSCLPDTLVDHIDVDVSGLDIGDSIHIKDIALPEGIKTTQEGHLTVAVVAAPTVITEEVEEIEEIEGEEEKEVEGEVTDTEDQSE
jgi:large subunit ribosomal protein L25